MQERNKSKRAEELSSFLRNLILLHPKSPWKHDDGTQLNYCFIIVTLNLYKNVWIIFHDRLLKKVEIYIFIYKIFVFLYKISQKLLKLKN